MSYPVRGQVLLQCMPVMCPSDIGGMTNSAGPDQTAP